MEGPAFWLDDSGSTRVVFGAGAIEGIGALTRDLGRRVLLVTSPGLVEAGHVARVEGLLGAGGLEVFVYDEVLENPTARDVDRCLVRAHEVRPEVLVGLGGGSAIDVAKGMNFVLAGGGRMHDYWGVGKARGDLLPLAAIPTTAGTGTETQSFALIADDDSHQKMACGDPRAMAKLVVLDPELTHTMPRFVTACTGLDAIGHAVETAVTRERNATSLRYSHEAFRLAAGSFERVLSRPEDAAARADMLRASSYAGHAIENSMLGAAHSMANPLTAHFDVPHGQAVAMALPHVVRFNAADPTVAAAYSALACAAGLATPETPDSEAAESLAARLQDFLSAAGLPQALGDAGVEAASLGLLAEEAARQWTAGFNPRRVEAPDFLGLYTAALAAGAR